MGLIGFLLHLPPDVTLGRGSGADVEPTQAEVRANAPAEPGWRILTVPNLISFLRLIGVPAFLYLFLGTSHHGWAIAILAVGGLSDWVDGFAARRLHQVSRLGELLDPTADRLYILATILAFSAKGITPWSFTIALLAREVVLGGCLLVLRRYGYGPPPVHYVGKTATFILLMAFPILLLAEATDWAKSVVDPSGWALAWWGLVLYWVAGAFYIVQVAKLVRAAPRGSAT
jgi:cardiolipin synthase (CMP-forming)